jgi:hypothetical protein
VADAEQLAAALRGWVALDRDPAAWPAALEQLQALARWLPGHFHETTAARILVGLGCEPVPVAVSVIGTPSQGLGTPGMTSKVAA